MTSPSAHAVELFRQRLTARGVITVAEAAKHRDRSMVRLAGLAVSVQHPMTAKNFVFIALEDETGMINVTVRPEIYQANAGQIAKDIVAYRAANGPFRGIRRAAAA